MKSQLQVRNILFTVALLLFGAMISGAQTLPDYAITGQVNDEFGKPAIDVRVCAYPADYTSALGMPCTRSKADGAFTIRTERPAHYTINAEKTDASYFYQFPFYEYSLAPYPKVVLDEQTRTANVLLTLPPKNGQLVGRAIDAGTGRPIDNLRFTLCQVADKSNCWSVSAQNANGEFRLFAPHVPFTLLLIAEGYEAWHGLYGNDNKQAIDVPSGTKLELLFSLKRRPLFMPN